jgi:hypothetical protein
MIDDGESLLAHNGFISHVRIIVNLGDRQAELQEPADSTHLNRHPATNYRFSNGNC